MDNNKNSSFKKFLNSWLGCLIIYTIIWLVFSAGIYLLFYTNGKSVLWVEDGAYQHFTSFNYSCDIAESVFSGEKSASTELFNYTLGRGADIITTLNSYAFTDPVQWICAFLIPLGRFARYTIMLFANLYLVGASFIIYCFATERKKLLPVLSGAVVYAFSGMILCMFMRHPNYINWAYFLPLLLAGYEMFRRRRLRLPMIIFVAMNAIVSFYTFYMNMILLVFYVLITCFFGDIGDKVLAVQEEDGEAEPADTSIKGKILSIFNRGHIKSEVFTGLKTAVLCVIGILLSAVFFFPTVYAYMNNARVAGASGYSASAFFYPPGYYKKVFLNIFQPYGESGFNTILGLAGVALFAVIVIFALRKFMALKVWIILCAVMLAVPIIGRLMNGFGYAVNRWSYAAAFFCALIVVEMLPRIRELPRLVVLISGIIGCVYIVLIFILNREYADRVFKATLIVLAVSVIAMVAAHFIRQDLLRNILLFALCIACAAFQVFGTFSPMMADYGYEYTDRADVGELFEDSSELLSGMSTPDDFFRVESRERHLNIDGMLDVKSTDIWWSMLPSYMLNSLLDMEMNEVSYNCFFPGSDGRTAVLELASVRYYTEPYNGSSLVPAGFIYNPLLSTGDYYVYENEQALPVAYTFNGYIPESEYKEMSALERQQVLLQAAVIEDKALRELDYLSHADVQTEIIPVDIELQETDWVDIIDNTIYADETGNIVYSADIPDGCEIYLRLGGIEITEPDTAVIYVNRSDDFDYSVTKLARITNMENEWPVVRDGVTMNLGIGGAGQNTIMISFSDNATFTFDSIELFAVPMDTYYDQVAELKEYTLENVYVGRNRISGDITLPESKLLQFSVPYSKGWKAQVNGRPAKLYRSGGMYMMLALPGGDAHIELRYSTPFMALGAVFSILTLAGIIIFSVVFRKKPEKNE